MARTQHVSLMPSGTDPDTWLVNDTPDPLARSLSALDVADVVLGAPPLNGSAATFPPPPPNPVAMPVPAAHAGAAGSAWAGWVENADSVWDRQPLMAASGSGASSSAGGGGRQQQAQGSCAQGPPASGSGRLEGGAGGDSGGNSAQGRESGWQRLSVVLEGFLSRLLSDASVPASAMPWFTAAGIHWDTEEGAGSGDEGGVAQQEEHEEEEAGQASRLRRVVSGPAPGSGQGPGGRTGAGAGAGGSAGAAGGPGSTGQGAGPGSSGPAQQSGVSSSAAATAGSGRRQTEDEDEGFELVGVLCLMASNGDLCLRRQWNAGALCHDLAWLGFKPAAYPLPGCLRRWMHALGWACHSRARRRLHLSP